MWDRFLGREDGATPIFLPKKSLDRGAWQATVHGVANSWTRATKHTHT